MLKKLNNIYASTVETISEAMYLIAFSCFTKTGVTNDNANKGWDTIYSHVVKLKVVEHKKLEETIKSIISKDKLETKIGEGEVRHTFPIAIKTFESKEELDGYRKVLPLINYRLKNIKNCKKRFNDAKLSKQLFEDIPSITCIRHIKVNSKENDLTVQTMELNNMTCQIVQIVMKLINISAHKKKENRFDLEEYKKLRAVDKCMSKYSTFTALR